MKYKGYMLVIFLVLSFNAFAFELLELANSPTAGMLQKGEADTYCKVYRDNGFLTGAKVGLFSRFMFGVSYGAEELVGNNDPIWHDKVDFNAKVRIIDESPDMPAIAVGVDTKGHGAWNKDLKRYSIKSKGFYAVLSRNFEFLGNFGFHLGANYSLETSDDDKDPSVFAGFDKSIGPAITLLADYDCAFNDNNWKSKKETLNNEDNLKMADKGFLNVALRINLSENIFVKIMVFDVLQNSSETNALDRALQVHYTFGF